MIAIRPIASCGPIADCSICPPDNVQLCVETWTSSEFPTASLLELGNGCLVCVPDYCDKSTVYAYPLDSRCTDKVDPAFDCSGEDMFETVICVPKHDNYVYAPPCGPFGTRGQWVKELNCNCSEAA